MVTISGLCSHGPTQKACVYATGCTTASATDTIEFQQMIVSDGCVQVGANGPE